MSTIEDPLVAREVLVDDELERFAALIRRTETRLYHGLLVARVALPSATLLVLAVGAEQNELAWKSVAVWAILAAWTAATTAFAWSRLAWAQRMPYALRIEIAVFVGLVFVGFGTRPWHLLHCFIPLSFASLFASQRAARIVGVGMIAALWAVYPVTALWPHGFVDQTFAAPVPTAIIAATTALLVYVRRIVDDIDTIVDAQRQAATAIAAARRALVLQAARIEMHRPITRRLSAIVARLSGSPKAFEVPLSASARVEADALLACMTAIESTISELDDDTPPHQGDDVHLSGLREIRSAIERSNGLGGAIALDCDHAESLPLSAAELAPFRRIVREAIVNSRKHGRGQVAIQVFGVTERVLEVRNAGDSLPAERPGGSGLESLHQDAERLEGTISWTLRDGEVVFTLTLPPFLPISAGPELADSSDVLRSGLEHRRSAYQRTILATRIGLCALALVTIETGRSQHRSLLPVLMVSAALLLLANASLFVWHRKVSSLLARRARLVWIDGAVIVVLIAFETGMASPWMPLSMCSLLAIGLYAGPRAATLLAGFLSVAMLGGYELVRSLPLDDAGTLAQDMPIQWVWNSFVLGAVAACAGAIGWAFARCAEATASYEQARALKRQVERESALADVEAETRRELHASLQQYLAAAELRCGLLRRVADVPGLDELEEQLAELREAVRQIVQDLGRRGAVPALA